MEHSEANPIAANLMEIGELIGEGAFSKVFLAWRVRAHDAQGACTATGSHSSSASDAHARAHGVGGGDDVDDGASGSCSGSAGHMQQAPQHGDGRGSAARACGMPLDGRAWEPCAVKMTRLETSTAAAQWHAEATILQSLAPAPSATTKPAHGSQDNGLAARAHNPNIIRFLGSFRHADAQHGRVGCLVLEHCDGRTLADAAAHGLALGPSCDVMRQVCSGLAFLHTRFIAHCDIKQENIMVVRAARASDPRDTLRIGDFGAALRFSVDALPPTAPSAAGAHGPAHTSAATSLVAAPDLRHGYAPQLPRTTLCYSPPERFATTDLTLDVPTDGTRYSCGPRYDSWGLGCLLWEALTGECLPMGAGTDILGRVAHRCRRLMKRTEYASLAEWEGILGRYIATVEQVLAAMPHMPPSSTPAAEAQQFVLSAARQTFPALLAQLLSLDPAQRPSAGTILERGASNTADHCFFKTPV